MAIYHLSVKAISRSAGRSATAAAAYRAGCQITDERTGEVHDYTRKDGVIETGIAVPAESDWKPSRSELWNTAEAAERRKDACVAREHEVALPAELPPGQRYALVRYYAQDLAKRHGCAVDFAIHAPTDADGLNWHAHILCTTREVSGQGLGQKCQREKAGQNRREGLEFERQHWAWMVNGFLERSRIDARVDHRSLKEQGIDREPTTHLGPVVTEMKRRGKQSEVLTRIEREAMIEKIRKNSIKADAFLLQKTEQQIEAAKAVLDAALKKAREEKPVTDIVISQPAPQRESNRSSVLQLDIAISGSAETVEQYVARKTEQTSRRFTIAQIGKRIIGTLEKIKHFADQVYGVIDVGLGDRLLVRHNFSSEDVGRSIKGYQRSGRLESDMDRAPKDRKHGIAR
jgi:ATP-dependent exoDNAse (exonuclease V) alpha subunit